MSKLKKLVKELEDSFSRWEHINKYGAQDPLWPDGCNMNLVRNHTLYYKDKIKELCIEMEAELPDIYYRQSPPKVDADYMAQAKEIRKNIAKTIAKNEVEEMVQMSLF